MPWQLRSLEVCASTERELERWLRTRPPMPPRDGAMLDLEPLWSPRAVLARRQRFGHGQKGRVWQSPPGGLWLSAALPWPEDPASAAAPGLAVALALARQLARNGVNVALKWPNDLLLDTPSGPCKLAGLLPGLRLRAGRIRWARIGVGLNGRNPVPAGAVDLRNDSMLLSPRPELLAALMLTALEEAIRLAHDPEAVRLGAEALLIRPTTVVLDGHTWTPYGLSVCGGLRISRADGETRVLRRF